MRFKIGFVAGLAAGYWFGTIPADQRKAKVEELWSSVRDNPRVQRVTDTVSRDARRLGDAVEQRIVKGADGAVDKVAGDRQEPADGPQDAAEAGPGMRSA